ncbi:EamA-like transporter family protein [Roseovarius sp. A-2]|uniref:DMT family transporter n=1 Tax=Roseovarius sp. A-2 TaxID=1570360 RepID=UPI0009B526ED|nr:EamA family transporter [Roseovarius sp. A-2]GAW36036.1 EamA-like transporter family protein [Roseovarius sp. A-2]
MDLWIILSVAAASFQTLRFMLQKHLSMGALSAGGATLARFFYSAPFVVTLAFGYLWATGAVWPGYSPLFWLYAVAGGLSQILATWCVVALFSERNFAVGITFKKTEVVQTAIVGLVILGDRITVWGLAAIVLGLLGVLILSETPGLEARWWRRFTNRAAFLGLASGAFFAVSAVGYRGATLEIASSDPLLRAGLALAVVTVMQTVALTLWLIWREPGQVGRVIAAHRTAVWMGLTGMAGSLCWFTAFTLENAAMVFAVGQVEVIFSLFASVLVFGERITRREGWGMALITLSVIAVVMLR